MPDQMRRKVPDSEAESDEEEEEEEEEEVEVDAAGAAADAEDASGDERVLVVAVLRSEDLC
jgi:hypothetical protein